MANISWQGGNYVYSLATFKAYGENITTALNAMGFVQTADTGQLDFSTASSYSLGSGVYFGYQVWRFNDTLQSTRPIFFKVHFITGSFSSSAIGFVGIRLEVGSSTNGSGGITGHGNYGIVQQAVPGGSGTALTYNNFMSSDGSGFVYAHMIDSPNADNSCMFMIDRFRDANGNALGDGFVLGVRTRNAATWSWFLSFNTIGGLGRYPYNTARGSSLLPSALGAAVTNSVGPTSYFSPYYSMVLGGNGLYHLKMIMSYASADYGFNSNQVVPHMGSNKTYKTLGTQIGYADSRNQQYASHALWWSD